MSECKCSLRGRLVGDGCEVCNPALALEYAKERIAELQRELDVRKAAIEAQFRLMERVRALEEALESTRGALADIGNSTDMTKAQMQHKALRIYQSTAGLGL